VDWTDLFKISKLVYDAKVIVTSLYGNLQKQPVNGRYSELAGLSFSVKVENLRELFETTDVVNSDSFGHLTSCRRDSILVTLTQFKTNRRSRKGV